MQYSRLRYFEGKSTICAIQFLASLIDQMAPEMPSSQSISAIGLPLSGFILHFHNSLKVGEDHNLLSVENGSLKRRRPSVWGRTRIIVKKLSRDNLFYCSKHEAAGSEGGGAKLTKGTLSTALFTLHALYTQDYLQAAPCLSLLQQPLPCGSQVIVLPLESLHAGDLLWATQFRLGLLC